MMRMEQIRKQILVLSARTMEKPDVCAAVQQAIASQMKDGVIVIPDGYDYDIVDMTSTVAVEDGND